MKIEPVGVERDRQIAELRGDRPDTICGLVGGECPYPVNELCRLDCKHVIIEPQVNPYSTDISAAMELWAEMINSGVIGFDRWELHTCSFEPDDLYNFQGKRATIINRWTDIKHYTKIRHKTLNEAIADAISGAWLRHKGGDNG